MMVKRIKPGTRVETKGGKRGIVFSVSESSAAVRFDADPKDFLHRSGGTGHFVLKDLTILEDPKS